MSIQDRSLLDARLLDTIQHDDDTNRFTVESEADARKAFRAIKAAESRQAQLEDERDDEIQTVKDFYNGRIKQQTDSIEFLKQKIQQFVRSTGETLSTPMGKAYTQKRTKWQWAERKDLIEWAKEHRPDLIQTQEKVSKNDLKKMVKDEWDKTHEDDPPFVKREARESVVCYTQ